MYQLLRMRNDGLRERMIQFARDLVRTASPSLSEAAVADRVEAEMRDLGYQDVVRDDAGNVVGVFHGRESAPTLLMTCHMDTMPAGAVEEWTDDPLCGKIEDGRLYGLGAGDCKGGLAAYLYAGALLKRSLLPLRGNLVVAMTVAQENGSNGGVRALFEKTLPDLELKPDYAMLGEPTGLGLYYGHDGWTELEIRVEGANASQVDDATRAVLRSLDATPAGDEVEALIVRAPRFDDLENGRRGMIRLGRRLYESEKLDTVLNQVKHTASLATGGSEGVAVDVAVRQEEQTYYTGTTTVARHVTNAWAIDPYHRLMTRARQALGAAGCGVKTGKWQLGRLGMGTAGSVLVGEFGVPTIGYGPGCEDHVHTPNEAVETAAVSECAYGAAAVAHSLIGIPVCGWTSDEI